MASVFGTQYLETADFRTAASSFGAGLYLAGYTDNQISDFLAIASRLIEAYTNRNFDVDPQVERQPVDLTTRRIRVNKPDVASVVSAVLQTVPTPTTLDVTQLLINNQDNYIEIPSGQLHIGNPHGAVDYPDVTITYHTTQSMPPKSVMSAVGFTAAAMLLQDQLNRRSLPGMNSTEVGEITVTRDTTFNMFNTSIIPQAAKDVLAGDTVASRRIVPQGYPSRTVKNLPQYQNIYPPNKGWW